MPIVDFTEDATHVYAHGADFEPGKEVYLEIRSVAVDENASTEGVTASVHKTADADGKVTFRVVKDFLLPDLPRELEARGAIGHEVFTS